MKQTLSIAREKETLTAMIGIYCRKHHQSEDGLCAGCRELEAYAFQRLDACPWGMTKPSCRNCEIHCYHPEKREQIREVMRYARPRLILEKPLLIWHHFF